MVKKEKKQKTISYRLQFNDTAIFMASSLSNFVNNLAEGINKIKWKYGHDDKQCDTCRIKDKDCELNTIKYRKKRIKYNCCLDYIVSKLI